MAADFIGKEIVKCITLAEDGIHAVLLVFSLRVRLTVGDESVLRYLQTLFGSKIAEYLIIVYTGGDELEENEETLEEYLADGSPEFLKDLLELCDNRIVSFDNKTTDKVKKTKQVQKLLSLVDSVVRKNNGIPYNDEFFQELKDEAIKLRDEKKRVESLEGYHSKDEISEFKKEINLSYDMQLSRITDMVETKLRETAKRLEQQLSEEQAARLEAEKRAYEVQTQSNDEIKKLRETLEKAEEKTKELEKKVGKCINL